MPDVAYRPAMADRDWALLQAFVLDAVARVRSDVPYPQDVLLHVVAHHAHWVHLVAGMSLEISTVFRRDVIGYSVAMMPTRSSSTMGRTRSVLLRIGEALGVIETPSPLPRLAPAEPSDPYAHEEVEELRTWAYLQRDLEHRASAQALLALGLGAGLPTRDLARVRLTDVDLVERTVHVAAGDFPRRVPVRDTWMEDLAEAAELTPGTHLTLFRPGVLFHKNTVLTFVQRTIGVGITPTTQRMRVTWLVEQLSKGTPMQDLLYAAGLKSMDALVRYQRFLPRPSSVDQPGTPPSTRVFP